MLDRPRNRIWPSLIFVARSNTLRQVVGLKNGSRPSTTNISANAPSTSSHTLAAANAYFRAAGAGGAAAGPLLPRRALKNSLLGSTTITSERLRKLAR
jgi:hypothetical protein